MKQVTTTIFVLLISVASIAQADEKGVRDCLQNYMSGEPDRVEKAFHPSATMKYVDYKTAEFKDVPVADYIERVKAGSKAANGARPSRTIEIISLNVEGTAAQAKIRIETDKVIMFDYMNLLKLGEEWKIVSKIFSRQDK